MSSRISQLLARPNPQVGDLFVLADQDEAINYKITFTELNDAIASSISSALTPTQATDLTDGGDSALHYHASDRDRANHTGTQTLSTISDAGTLAGQNANAVNITGGSISGIPLPSHIFAFAAAHG